MKIAFALPFSGLVSALLSSLSIGLLGCATTPQEIHRDAIVIDTHSDTTPRFEREDWDFTERHSRNDSHMDLPRIREGGFGLWKVD